MRKHLFFVALLLPSITLAQTFDFDMTASHPIYSDEVGYGFDIISTPVSSSKSKVSSLKGNSPFYFSVKVPDGNYKVKVELGSKKKLAIL